MSSTARYSSYSCHSGLPQKLAAAVSQHAQELDIVLLEERQHTVIEQIGRRDRRLAARIICDGQPLVTTGCGYLPIGYLTTGYLPIGALPTGGAGGGGSLRGRSAAAAALSMAKDAPIAVRSLSIINPLCLNRIFPAAPVRSPLMFVGSGVHRCTFTNALAETIAQQESSDAP